MQLKEKVEYQLSGEKEKGIFDVLSNREIMNKLSFQGIFFLILVDSLEIFSQ